MAIPLEDLEASARGVAKAIDRGCPEGVGFILVLFDFGDAPNVTYLSNAQREDGISVLRELLARWEKGPQA